MSYKIKSTDKQKSEKLVLLKNESCSKKIYLGSPSISQGIPEITITLQNSIKHNRSIFENHHFIRYRRILWPKRQILIIRIIRRPKLGKIRPICNHVIRKLLFSGRKIIIRRRTVEQNRQLGSVAYLADTKLRNNYKNPLNIVYLHRTSPPKGRMTKYG
jgi:hypothetical protein